MNGDHQPEWECGRHVTSKRNAKQSGATGRGSQETGELDSLMPLDLLNEFLELTLGHLCKEKRFLRRQSTTFLQAEVTISVKPDKCLKCVIPHVQSVLGLDMTQFGERPFHFSRRTRQHRNDEQHKGSQGGKCTFHSLNGYQPTTGTGIMMGEDSAGRIPQWQGRKYELGWGRSLSLE